MNNCHLWILKIYQVDIRNIHYPWYIDGIRKIYAKIYAIVYYVFCTVADEYFSFQIHECGSTTLETTLDAFCERSFNLLDATNAAI